jgi:hypothetical protein
MLLSRATVDNGQSAQLINNNLLKQRSRYYVVRLERQPTGVDAAGHQQSPGGTRLLTESFDNYSTKE